MATAAGSVNGSAINRTTFDDALGEDPAAPDIATVRVSNNDEGTLTFRIALPNRPTLGNDMRFSLSIDADSNAETGLTGSGIDYRLLYDFYLHGDRLLWLLTCGPSVCTSGAKLPFSYESGPVVTIDRAELGNAASASSSTLWTASSSIPWRRRSTSRTRTATRTLALVVRLGPSRLLVQRFATTPAKPAAGKTFLARLKVKRDDSGALVTTGKVACHATVGRARLRRQRGSHRALPFASGEFRT